MRHLLGRGLDRSAADGTRSREPDTETLRRIVEVGTSGSGKTTLARQLAARLGLPHVELDALRHGPGWAETPDDCFRELIAQRLREEAWVVDGNYSVARDLIWRRAELLVWLDYSRLVTMARLIRRTFWRVVTREELWNGNQEDLRLTLSRESVIVWAWSTYHRRRREYPELLGRPEYGHLTVVRLRIPRDAARWLDRVGRS